MRDDSADEGRLPWFRVLSRRRFLKWGLTGAGAVVAAGGGLFGLRGCAPSVDGLRTLSDHEYRTMAAIADAIIPPGGAFALGAAECDLARAFDTYLADEPAANVRDLKRALLLVEFGPVVFDLRAATFSNLSPEERRAHWDGWGASESEVRRQVAVAFRRFVALVFYDRPEAWAALGYPGPGGGV
jgi:hypothetical protein